MTNAADPVRALARLANWTREPWGSHKRSGGGLTMQTVMLMRWAGVTAEQYEEARSRVDWEGNVPDGAVLHVAGVDGDDLRVTDVWESAEQFQRFVDERLMPAVQEIGIEGEPEVRLYPLQAIFNPRVPAVA
jgi:hypothetical protein